MTLQHTPGELAFGRDMILPFPSKINWPQLFQCKQDIISYTNQRDNLSRRNFDYEVGKRILILNKNQHKSKLEATVLNGGHWAIQQVHSTGTVTILRNKYHGRLNIYLIRPLFEKANRIFLERQSDIKYNLNECQMSVCPSFL